MPNTYNPPNNIRKTTHPMNTRRRHPKNMGMVRLSESIGIAAYLSLSPVNGILLADGFRYLPDGCY